MKPKGDSIPKLLEVLWNAGFFSRARSISEISKALAANGHHCVLSSLGSSLLRAARPNGLLNRKLVSGQWEYRQKHPPTSTVGQRTELLGGYDFHPRIKQVALEQFKNEDFKGAIQNALVEVIHQVKIKAHHPKNQNGKELDGDDLMNQVFGCDNQVPKIKFNDLETGLDKAEQRGLMHLFKGIVGIRDKKAHLNFIQRDQRNTIEYLALASLLMRLLDKHALDLET